MMRHVSLALCAALLALGTLPCQAGSDGQLQPVSMKFDAGFDPITRITTMDLLIENHLGFAVDVFGEYRIYLQGQEVRRAAFDTSSEPSLDYRIVLTSNELPRPLPRFLSVCAVVDWSLQIVDRKGNVRELEDIEIRCRQLPTTDLPPTGVADQSQVR